MFQSIVENQARSPASPGAPAGATASIELVKDVARIQTMMEREGATLGEAYTYFEETVYPQIQKDGAGVPQIMKNQIAGVLLNRLALEKPRDFESNLLPSATRITEVMVDLDVLTTSAWAGLLIHMIQLIYRQDTNPDSYDSIKDFETAMALRDGLLHDLLGAWRVFCAQRSTDKPDSKTQRSFKAPRGNAKAQQPSSLQKAFGAMFPQYLVPSLLRPTFAAFATYKLLTDPFNRSRAIKGEAASFLQMMKEVIFQTRPPRREDFKPVFDVFPDLPRYVWPQKQSKDKGRVFLDSASVFGEKPDRFRATVHRQLGEAIKSRNLETVRRAWVAFWGEAAVPEAARISELANSPDMFDYFIFAYTMMRRPQQAIEVWNNMERIGVKPTIKTWSSMLHGCVKGNNVRGIRTVWDKLIVSGVQLDTTIWTARIHGLFACGEPDAGLRALNEMATTWAAREDPRYAAMAVQPTVEPVNAAVSGLLRLNRDADATRVLSWASKKGINPDIYTFNTLLRPLVRRGDLDGIDEIFATMRSINISADVATFTVLLEGTLSNIGDLAPEQQVTTVERILEAMKKSGIAINMQMYAKVFYLLLQDGDRTEEPVKAMLSHIWRRGLELTSHIYTMLAEHYFSRDPPDADAVTALIDNRRLHENKGIDRVFWERVMKGYCQAGELARAMDIFDRVFANGTTVTFSTLYDLLRPLVDAGDGAAAMRVVNAARKIGKPDDAGSGASASQDGLGRRQWKHRFWHLAYEEGLMEEPLVERFRGANAGPVDVNA
jgi:pentatricopeptide repeat protein